jgi:hypothetical protein
LHFLLDTFGPSPLASGTKGVRRAPEHRDEEVMLMAKKKAAKKKK